jgi:uncharacterized protein (TIGR00730 family)
MTEETMSKSIKGHKSSKLTPAKAYRLQKLPTQKQKSVECDPLAIERTQAIMESSNYQLAVNDLEFLKQSETKGIRLQLDYLKTELLLQEYGIEHTIVVFGGTRVVEETEAKEMVEKSKQVLSEDPQNSLLSEKYQRDLRILDKSRFYEIGRAFGRLVGQSRKGPEDNSLTLMTGGGSGAMEAANRGAFDVGSKSIGLNIVLPQEQFPNPYITPELAFQFHYFSMRKLHFFRRARALVAFPGGFGTLDELMEALTLVQTRKIPPFPIILVGREFWDKLIDFDYLLDEGLIDSEDMELFWYAETAQEIWDDILQWHEENGTPLI